MDNLSEQLSALISQGRKDKVRRLLAGIIREDPTDARAWAMMAELVDAPQQEADCLRRVLELTDDLSLREWAAARLAGPETGEPLEEPIAEGPQDLYSDDIHTPTASSSRPSKSFLLVLSSVTLIVSILGLLIMAAYWWFPRISPRLAAMLPFQPVNTPTLMPIHALPTVLAPMDTPAPTAILISTATKTQTPMPTLTLTPTAFVFPSETPTPTLTPTLAPLNCSQEGLPETACVGVRYNGSWAPYIEEINGTQMTLVPAGCFMMGSSDSQIRYILELPASENSRMTFDEEQPAHKVCFARPFWIDVYEVTNDQYGSAGCLDYLSGPGQPRNCVGWQEAADFCAARDARLPTEAEWEYAARGPDRLIFPWGNEFVGGYVVWKAKQTADVGSIPEGASWVAALDLSGNVWEWVSDWYSETYYTTLAGGGVDPQGPLAGKFRAIRGGSWDNYKAITFHAAGRSWDIPTKRSEHLGFRCARSITSD